MYGNGRPIGNRKKVQLLVALTILAWATQTLFRQWARGADLPPAASGANGAADVSVPPPDAPAAGNAVVPAERFVPASPREGLGATLELRGEATVFGPEVRLRQICRWADADGGFFTPVADLVVLRFDGRTPFRSITIDELKTTLADAKANMAVIRFAGPLKSTVRRSDAPAEPTDALQQWIDARNGAGPAAAAPAAANPAAQPGPVLAAARGGVAGLPGLSAAPATRPAVPAADSSPVRSLRQLLTEDLSVRFGIPVEQLQVAFNPKDERVLDLSEPLFRFNLEPVRVRNLGEVSWDVLVVHQTGSQKVPVSATARAWQAQLVAARPLAARQVLRPEDFEAKRALVDRLPDDPLLALSQLVGQQAARDIKAGSVLTARMVDAVPLAKPGQYVTINVNQGGVRIQTAGKAMEGGSFGQVIRVRNDATNDIYEVVLTGPQEGSIGPPPAAAAAKL